MCHDVERSSTDCVLHRLSLHTYEYERASDRTHSVDDDDEFFSLLLKPATSVACCCSALLSSLCVSPRSQSTRRSATGSTRVGCDVGGAGCLFSSLKKKKEKNIWIDYLSVFSLDFPRTCSSGFCPLRVRWNSKRSARSSRKRSNKLKLIRSRF